MLVVYYFNFIFEGSSFGLVVVVVLGLLMVVIGMEVSDFCLC